MFSLSITFRMIIGSEMQFHIQSDSERAEEMGNEFRSTVGSDVALNSVLVEDVKNEELCKLVRCNRVVSRNEKSLLGEMINNDQYSSTTGGLGAAAVLYREGTSPRVLRCSLGTLVQHTTYKAEAVGLLLALHLLQRTQDVHKATIHIDNQAVINSLSIRKPKSVQYLIDEIFQQIDNLWEQATHPTYMLEIMWIKGHSSSVGNEEVDWEAKKAAEGNSTRIGALLSLLEEGSLPLSVTATWQAFAAKLWHMWETNWKESLQFVKFTKIDLKMPSMGFKRLTTLYSRLQTSLLVQLQSGHMPLTAVCIIQGMRLFILKKNKCLMNSISPSILHRMI